MNSFVDYIESIKRDTGLSDRDLAEIMGVSEAGLENFERGYVPPSQRAMSRLISALALRPEEGVVLPPDRLPFETSFPRSPGEGFAVEAAEGGPDGLGIEPGSVVLLKPCPSPSEGDILLIDDGGRRRFTVCGEEPLPPGAKVLGRVAALRRDHEQK